MLEDRCVGVGVFPEGEKILVGGAGFRGVCVEDIGPGKSEVRERARRTSLFQLSTRTKTLVRSSNRLTERFTIRAERSV